MVDGGIVAFTTSLGQNRLNVLDTAGGRLLWNKSFEIPAGGLGMPRANIAAFEDQLIIPAWDLYGVDRATGNTRWHFSKVDDYPGAKELVIGAGTIFACGKRLYALDARSGVLKWELDIQEEPFSPVYAYGTLYFTTRINQGGGLGPGHAVAVDPANGTVLWTFALPNATDASWLGGSVSLAGVTETQVIVPSLNGRVYALDRQTGALQWERRGRGPYTRGVILNSIVVVGGDALYVEAINLNTGVLAWEIPIDGSTDYINGGPGVVIVNDGRLRAVNEAGQVIWSYGGELYNQPHFIWAPVYTGRTIFVGGMIGETRRGLYAIDVPF